MYRLNFNPHLARACMPALPLSLFYFSFNIYLYPCVCVCVCVCVHIFCLIYIYIHVCVCVCVHISPRTHTRPSSFFLPFGLFYLKHISPRMHARPSLYHDPMVLIKQKTECACTQQYTSANRRRPRKHGRGGERRRVGAEKSTRERGINNYAARAERTDEL